MLCRLITFANSNDGPERLIRVKILRDHPTSFINAPVFFTQGNLLALRGVHESQMMDLLQTHADDNNGSSRTYPSTLGLDEKPETKAKLALFLVKK
jgi:hypothetical protein